LQSTRGRATAGPSKGAPHHRSAHHLIGCRPRPVPVGLGWGRRSDPAGLCG
jgi:hypothetical protein